MYLDNYTNILHNKLLEIFYYSEIYAMVKQIPARIYRCELCGYTTIHRWALRRHLTGVHKLKKKYATEVAARSEYWISPPSYIRRNIDED